MSKRFIEYDFPLVEVPKQPARAIALAALIDGPGLDVTGHPVPTAEARQIER